MNDFDDPTLASLLDDASGPDPDAALAYGAVLGRVKRAKQRRAAVAVAGAGLACVLGVVAVTSATSPESQRIVPADPVGVTNTVDDGDRDDTSTSTSAVRSSVIPVPVPDPSATSTPVTPPSAPDSSTAPGAPAASSPASTPTTAAASPTTVAPTPTTNAPSTSSPAPNTTAAPSGTQTYQHSCIGGSATIQRSGSTLSLVGWTAASGFTMVDQDLDSNRIRVKFESATLESRVQFELIGSTVIESCEEGPAS